MDFLWPLQPLKKAAIKSLYIVKSPPYYIYKEPWNLSWCQRPNSSVVERSLPNPAIRVRDSLEAKMELCWKNADFFLLIEKTLGNVSPCFELAFSLSFKELGSKTMKDQISIHRYFKTMKEKIIHSQLFLYPFTESFKIS